MINYYLVLGLEETASDCSLEQAHEYLSQKLNPANFRMSNLAERQSRQCLLQIDRAYHTLKNAELKTKHQQSLKAIREDNEQERWKPKLGHICVAAGIISLQDLEEAVTKQTDIDLPLGQILQERKLLSQTELDGLLMGQALFSPPRSALDKLACRLLALGIVSEDMLKIVLFDQRTMSLTLAEHLVKRGWLAQEVVDVLQAQPQEKSIAS